MAWVFQTNDCVWQKARDASRQGMEGAARNSRLLEGTGRDARMARKASAGALPSPKEPATKLGAARGGTPVGADLRTRAKHLRLPLLEYMHQRVAG
jgi:hypothetical protein